MKPIALVAACLLAFTVAGCANTSCTNNSGGQECEAVGSLTYNGAANGGHDATVSCDTTATFHVSANVGGGQVVFTVRDGSGSQIHSKTAQGSGQTTENKALTGADGTWTLHAERSGNILQPFSGQYEANITC